MFSIVFNLYFASFDVDGVVPGKCITFKFSVNIYSYLANF
jgi:hypothetical protein